MFDHYIQYRSFPSFYETSPFFYGQPFSPPYFYHSFNYVPMPLQYISFQQQPNGLLQAFFNENGSFNFVKAAKTVDKMVQTVNQVVPILKQLSSLFQRL